MTATEQKTLDFLASLTDHTLAGTMHWEADPMRHEATLRTSLGARQVVLHERNPASLKLLGANRAPILELESGVLAHEYAMPALHQLIRIARDESRDTAGTLDEVMADLAALGELG